MNHAAQGRVSGALDPPATFWQSGERLRREAIDATFSACPDDLDSAGRADSPGRAAPGRRGRRTATDAWAAGFTGGGSLTPHALILHWDGSHWSPMTSPSLGTGNGSRLDDVTATSPTDLLVIGRYLSANGSSPVPVVLHWNDSTWTGAVPPISGQGTGGIADSVSESATGQVWVAGFSDLPGNAVGTVANCTEPRGAVLIQNPDPGVQVAPGTPVSLVESTGRQPNGHLCVIN